MFILSMSGSILAAFDKYDIKSVRLAEAWIKHHRYFIYKFETIQGNTYITVKSY